MAFHGFLAVFGPFRRVLRLSQVVDEFLERMAVTIGNYAIYQARLKSLDLAT